MDRIKIGKAGEEEACGYLKNKGYTIVAQNFRCRHGEVDIVATQGEDLVFIEVKTRNNRNFGRPCEAVGWKKQRHIQKTAMFYLTKYGSVEMNVRFDVVEVEKEGIHHIENAFPYQMF
ncbi:YraN family protein [Alkalibacter rhizosphaerae]|uniref:UPF0102 protein J0B03_01075 n=1 Tax=Alkalibacter rhizosphaerae TaxID=2815577 RepID=A0A974XF48_9FIRM|nr:YraN family protein [Alkalibacter rhizosphaerae]QSX08714.1 YraN family protein [Alkalibacter rhizosphaerae]